MSFISLTFCRNNIDKSHWSLLLKPLYQLCWRLANVQSCVSHKKCLILSIGSTQPSLSNHWLTHGGTKSRDRNEFGNTGRVHWSTQAQAPHFYTSFAVEGTNRMLARLFCNYIFIFVQTLLSPWDFGQSSTGGTISLPEFCHFQPKLTLSVWGKERSFIFWSCPAWGVWRKGASLPLAASPCVT